MQQTHHRSIGKSAHKHIVLFPLGGSAIKGKGADFTSNHRVAHNLFSQLSFFLQSDIDTSVQGHLSHQQGDFDVLITDGRKFLGVQSSFVRSAHQVDRVGVQEQFKVQLDTGYQTFTRLEGWQMGSDDEGVSILAHQPTGQRAQFCIPTPISVVADIGIGTCGSHFSNHIELIDPALRG